ncbi:MAG TPA: HlyD family type I secretion periplasmic adaptor subunit [Stellaceae bacterium]|nr:HlyD family type I secretion periplasmic adaptor subunit [Stellaceae bacterium]
MKSLRSSRPAGLEAAPDREVRVFRSDTAEIVDGKRPVQARITIALVVGMLTLLLLIACMQIDRVISSVSGQVVTVEPTVVLGALDQSIIRSIDVGEGQRVKKGELLATLDPTFTTADVGALKAQVASLTAQIARCKAELAQKPFDMAPSQDPAANTYIAAQRAYYLQRKAQFDAQLRTYNDQIAQYKATIAKYQSDQAHYAERARISKEIEQMRATLAAAQVGSRLNLLAATDQKLEIERALEFDRNAMAESQHELDATTSTRDAFIQQWYAQISQELVTAQTNRDGAVEQLAKATKHQELVRLEAPEESVVLKIAKLSAASVLGGGEPLIYLAPLKSPFEAELHVSTRDIGFIRVGNDVSIKLDAYNFVDHGSAEGKVRWISEGSFTTDDSGAAADPYYKVRATLDASTLRNVPPGFRLVPGITLKGDIHIGTRTLFTYLFNGLMQGFDEAMREP